MKTEGPDRGFNVSARELRVMELIRKADAGRQGPEDVSIASEFRDFMQLNHGIRQHQLAEILGIDESAMSAVMKGKRTLGIKAARRAWAIGISAHVILSSRPGETSK